MTPEPSPTDDATRCMTFGSGPVFSTSRSRHDVPVFPRNIVMTVNRALVANATMQFYRSGNGMPIQTRGLPFMQAHTTTRVFLSASY